MAIEDSLTGPELERRVATTVRDRLPDTWRVAETSRPKGGAQRPDLEIEIEAPDGRRTRLVVEVKQVVERRDVARLGDQVRRRAAGPNDVPVVGARYLSPSVREALTREGLSYVDATGNVRLVSDRPVVFISDRGEDRDPWRKGRPRGTLKGEPAARVARALLDHRRDWRVRELIATSGASSGATYRVLEYLRREDLIAKDGDFYRVTDWERLLRAWSADAAFQDTARVTTFIEPRGVDSFLEKLSDDRAFPTAVTGSVAAKEWAGYAPARVAFVYVASVLEGRERWGLRPNTTAPNVILLEPATVGDVPFRNATTSRSGYPIAAPAQVAADLLNGPGREPAEGEYLIDWMKGNEEKWRRD